MSDKPNLHIRQESIPRKWSELDSAQKEALHKILAMMELYVDNANKNNKENKDYPWLRLDDNSNILFLDGDRGTGKSTVLYSLLKATINKTDEFFNQASKLNTDDSNEVEYLLNKISEKSLIWLESLDLELLPEPANLYAALMVRIEDVFKRDGLNKDEACFPYESAMFPAQPNHPWTRFSQLMRAASMAWSTNLEERKPSDPDTYSEEVLKTERSRLKLSKFNQVISDLSELISHKKGGKKPLFILPVDDADLNPARALDLFQLIRMINSPHILFLVVGKYENVEKLFELKYASDLSSRYPCKPRSEAHQRMIGQFASNTGYAAIKKLLPKGDQFIKLEGLTISEAYDFPNINQVRNSEKSLGEVLTDITISSDYIMPSVTLGDLFSLSKTLDSKDNQFAPQSQLAELLAGPIRAIYDLWRELFSLSQEQPEESKLQKLNDFVQRSYRGSLESEPAIPEWVKHYLRNVFQNQGHVHDLNKQAKHLIVHAALSSNKVENLTDAIGPSSIFRSAYQFHVSAINSESTQEVYFLENWRAAWLLLYHDLALLIPTNSIPRLDFSSCTNEWAKSTSISKQSVWVSWPSLTWFTFHHLETFKTYWDLFIKSQIKGVKNESDQEKLDFFAYIWIRGLAYVVAKKKIPLSMTDRVADKSERWEMHVVKIISQSKLNEENGFRIQYFVDLIVSMAVIASPESGVSNNMSRLIYELILKMLKKIKNTRNNFNIPSTRMIFNTIAQIRAENLLDIKDGKFRISFEEAFENLEYAVACYFKQTLAEQYLNSPSKRIKSILAEFNQCIEKLKTLLSANDIYTVLQSEQIPVHSYKNDLLDLVRELQSFDQDFLSACHEYKFEGPNTESTKNFVLRIFRFDLRTQRIMRQINDILSMIGDIKTLLKDNPNSQWIKVIESKVLRTIQVTLRKLSEEINIRSFCKYFEHPFEHYNGPPKYIYTDYPLSLKVVLGKALSLLEPEVKQQNKYEFNQLTEMIKSLPESGQRSQDTNA